MPQHLPGSNFSQVVCAGARARRRCGERARSSVALAARSLPVHSPRRATLSGPVCLPLSASLSLCLSLPLCAGRPAAAVLTMRVQPLPQRGPPARRGRAGAESRPVTPAARPRREPAGYASRPRFKPALAAGVLSLSLSLSRARALSLSVSLSVSLSLLRALALCLSLPPSLTSSLSPVLSSVVCRSPQVPGLREREGGLVRRFLFSVTTAIFNGYFACLF